jgi:hypothetical protein
MITLYRAISKAEKDDFDIDKQFRIGRNTLEGKQFFKSEEAVKEYFNRAEEREFNPPYRYLLRIEIDKECFEK